MTVLFVLLAVLVVCTGYAAGRVHQWYRTGLDRDDAYRDGYDTATRSVFTLAARVIGPRRAEKAAIRASAKVPRVHGSSPDIAVKPSARGSGTSSSSFSPFDGTGFPVPEPVSPSVYSVGSEPSSDDAAETGRHTVPEELVRAATYQLPPDRVARAKVPGAVVGEPERVSDPERAGGPAKVGESRQEAEPEQDVVKRLPDGDAPVPVPKPRSS